MRNNRISVRILAAGLAVFVSGVASTQNYPNKPIRIVTSLVGGPNDLTARLIGQAISGPLAQPVIVDNRGANGFEFVAKSAPDGYTLLLFGQPMWVGPLLQKAAYDPIADFAPITLLGSAPNILIVHPSVPAKSVKELIALAKARPGELNYAASSVGGAGHLAAELFKALAGVNIVNIPYKAAGPALNDLLGGQVQVMFVLVPTLTELMKAGRIRALAVTSAEPSALFPGLPTLAASGVPGYEIVAIYGVFAPFKTPTAIINRLNQEMVRALTQQELKEKLFNSLIEVVASSPQQLGAAVKADMARMDKVIKDSGIKLD